MKSNNLFRLIAVMLCTAFICATFSGCFITAVNAEIKSVTINVYGFDNGAAEITVVKNNQGEYDSLDVGVSIAWLESTNSRKNLNVSWSFVGDDLGCTVSIIDPCCTNGTIAYVQLGDKTGKVVLRATAKSKSQVSADLTIWIGQDSQTPTTTEGFYSLQQAHDLKFISRNDLRHISYFYSGGVREYSIDCDGGEISWYDVDMDMNMDMPKLADLSSETILDMKTAFYNIHKQEIDSSLQWLKDNGYENHNTTGIDTISILAFYGDYNGAYAIQITSSLWNYPCDIPTVTIAYNYGDVTGGGGISWSSGYPLIQIFRYDDLIPYSVGLIDNNTVRDTPTLMTLH